MRFQRPWIDLGAGWLKAALIMLALAFATVRPGPAAADTAAEIEVSVNVALERFYQEVQGARVFAQNAKGLLILPKVFKAGFIVGGEYGEGALRIGGETVDYYNIAAGSFGLQIGAQKKDIIIAFMTDEALAGFRSGSGWEVGADGNVALVNIGAGERLDTTTLKDPIVGFVFGVKGLMADLSLKGAKITRIEKNR